MTTNIAPYSLHIAIKTCLSFYNENYGRCYDISAKDIYDEILTTKHHDFYTTDEDILYPLSTFITKIADISHCDIVVACDNLTAQLALSLDKYCIIITDKKYQHDKNDKNCAVININDPNLYAKIGKAYRKITKQIQQNIYDENYKYYLQYKNDDSEQLYHNSLTCFKAKKYYATIWLLDDIEERYYNDDILSQYLKCYKLTKNHHQYIKIIEFMLKLGYPLKHKEYLEYLTSFIEIKQYHKAKKQALFYVSRVFF